MLQTRKAAVIKIVYDSDEIQELEIISHGKMEKAINYPILTGKVAIGDQVLLNTTAVELSLGTGGYHFVLKGPNPPSGPISREGHIMKLRYTPLQLAVGSCEEEGSPYHAVFLEEDSIEGMPVIVGGLHSMTPILAGYFKNGDCDRRVAYIMTDKGSLPLALSRHARALKELCWLDGTITVGHAFGGDLECVNIYTALLAAKHILRADVTIVAMGPGIVGTSTPLGFTGMEQVEALHAAHSLGGVPILVPRVSGADSRDRHDGISQHTKAILRHTLVPIHVPLLAEVAQTWPLESHGHMFHYKEEEKIRALGDLLAPYPLHVTTMGRGMEQDPLFFKSVAATADFAETIIDHSRDAPFAATDLGSLWRASTNS
ncbi:hypothetical protein BEP19_01405 [Ammoniphilus oxalaticus]|uniref:DUF3866 domain-containing protein n=1 Tax=Ammoniphilus oxalaticus TaxID=66863 RepID=A0A419SMW2_9BACL|nr:DUF3866 family protein [Ammoniphilus oxalaticus]RKD25628.1 hypothetical protein BEP19_01405 [Ammoniphilus oxalaticus]